jgi:hypothetical protein
MSLPPDVPDSHSSNFANVAPPRRSPDLLALISIASFAAALVGLARQVLGQAIATRLLAADWFSSSNTLAQMNSPVRLSGACGTLATLVLGGVAALLVRGDKRLTTTWYFLWVFGCVSLMNSGRLLYSAISGTGDWSVVVTSFSSPWLWRVGLAFAGVFIYRPALQFAARGLRGLVESRELAYRDLWRLVLTAYLTASAVLTAGAALDPANTGVVVAGVVAASFGLHLGLLVAPAFISEPVEMEKARSRWIAFHWAWLLLGVAASVAFFAGLGRAIRF